MGILKMNTSIMKVTDGYNENEYEHDKYKREYNEDEQEYKKGY